MVCNRDNMVYNGIPKKVFEENLNLLLWVHDDILTSILFLGCCFMDTSRKCTKMRAASAARSFILIVVFWLSRCQERPLRLNSLKGAYRDLQIRLRVRVRVRVFQCVPDAHARLREAVTSTRSVVKISSPS